MNIDISRTFCPVCNGYLGPRKVTDLTVLYCEECDTEFTYFPGMHMPTSRVHPSSPSSLCDCGNCLRQRQQIEYEKSQHYHDDED